MHGIAGLSGIECRKLRLRARIAGRRAEAARALAPIVKIAGWIDLAVFAWRQLPALAKIVGVPVSASIAALAVSQARWSRIVQWLPLVRTGIQLGQTIRDSNRGAQMQAFTCDHMRRPIDARSLPRTAEHGWRA